MGKGNPRLVAWEGDRTVTFTMEDALISPQSFSILSGAGLIDASEDEPIYVHTTQQVAVKDGKIILDNIPAKDVAGAEMYIMCMTEDGSIDSTKMPMKIDSKDVDKTMTAATVFENWSKKYLEDHKDIANVAELGKAPETVNNGDIFYVDYYVKTISSVKQIDIEAGKFGGSYYLEASTLFRNQADGEDYPAEFVIPNCKVQSNFTFTMAPTSDPSTFTFTMDAFPDYTKFDGTKKVIAALQIVEDKVRFGQTDHNDVVAPGENEELGG